MRLIPLFAAAALAAAIPSLASAQQALPQVQSVSPAATAAPAPITGYRRLEDMKVVMPGGEMIGEVESVLIDDAGRVAAVVVEVERNLGIGSEDVVMALDNARYVNGRLVVSLSRDQLAGLPRWKD